MTKIRLVAVAATAALMGALTYTPAMAISPNEPGYFNKCRAAYINDPATYERDCAGVADGSLSTTKYHCYEPSLQANLASSKPDCEA
jgi:hypothetical protein